eukprot:g13912.t1
MDVSLSEAGAAIAVFGPRSAMQLAAPQLRVAGLEEERPRTRPNTPSTGFFGLHCSVQEVWDLAKEHLLFDAFEAEWLDLACSTPPIRQLLRERLREAVQGTELHVFMDSNPWEETTSQHACLDWIGELNAEAWRRAVRSLSRCAELGIQLSAALSCVFWLPKDAWGSRVALMICGQVRGFVGQQSLHDFVVKPWQAEEISKSWELDIFACFDKENKLRWRPDFLVYKTVKHPSSLPQGCIGCRFFTAAGLKKLTQGMLSWDPKLAVRPAARSCGDCDDQVFMVPSEFVRTALADLAPTTSTSATQRYFTKIGKGESQMNMAWENNVPAMRVCGIEVLGSLGKHTSRWKRLPKPKYSKEIDGTMYQADPFTAMEIRSCRCCCNSTPLRRCSSSRCDLQPLDPLCT